MPSNELKKAGTPGGKKNKTGRPRLPRDENGNIIRTGIDQSYTPAQRKKRDGITYQCCCCGQIYDQQQKYFPTSSSPLFNANGGFVPICQECLEKYYTNIALPAVDGDMPRAVEIMCRICDWYWCDDLMETVEKINDGYLERGSYIPPFVTYGQRRNMTQYKKLGTTYIDTIMQRWEESKAVRSLDDLNKIDPHSFEARLQEVDAEDVWFFGPGYTPEQYRYLREQYGDWCERYDCQSKAQEEIFKSLAIAQLNVQIAQQEGNQKKTTESLKTLQELMDTAKIKPKQKDDSALVEQNTFGTLIQKWENEEPIPEPREEWRDVDGIKRYIGAFFLGHLCKVFSIDNEWAQIYDEEISRYTVEPPHYDQDDEASSAFDDKFKAMRGVKRDEEIGGGA